MTLRNALLALGLVLVSGCGGVVGSPLTVDDVDAGDASVLRDAASDHAIPVCTWPAALDWQRGVPPTCFASRALLVCAAADGGFAVSMDGATTNAVTVECLSSGVTSCSNDAGPSGPDASLAGCEDLCAPAEYAVECVEQGTGSTPSPPAGTTCRVATGGLMSAEVTFLCCSCD